MKVLLLKDVYKLGRAGDVKKVANGYGRNYLIPQGLAVLATPGALKQAERIRAAADARRTLLNQELSTVAEALQGQKLIFPARASETGRMYGSVTSRMIAEQVNEKFGAEINHRQVETQPIRSLGVYQVPIRLTLDLVPEVTVIVHREGEAPETAYGELEEGMEPQAVEVETEAAAEPVAEALEAVSEAVNQPDTQPETAPEDDETTSEVQ